MKKLFICCPTEGRNKEDVIKSIEKIHQYAELVTGEELKILPLTDIKRTKEANDGNPVLNIVCGDMVCIAKADYVICPERLYNFGSDFSSIATIEMRAAEYAGLETILIPEIAKNTFFPDLINDIPVNNRKCCCNTPADDPLRPIHLKPDTNSAELSDGEKSEN